MSDIQWIAAQKRFDELKAKYTELSDLIYGEDGYIASQNELAKELAEARGSLGAMTNLLVIAKAEIARLHEKYDLQNLVRRDKEQRAAIKELVEAVDDMCSSMRSIGVGTALKPEYNLLVKALADYRALSTPDKGDK